MIFLSNVLFCKQTITKRIRIRENTFSLFPENPESSLEQWEVSKKYKQTKDISKERHIWNHRGKTKERKIYIEKK